MSNGTAPNVFANPHFPSHNKPRVWFVTPAISPISVSLIRKLLEHGDKVAATLLPLDLDGAIEKISEFKEFLQEVRDNESWRARLKIIGMDIRLIGECQSAIAEAISVFGHIDILFCCSSEAVIGTIEELSSTPYTQSLVRTQFGTNFFGPVALIKSCLPHFRSRQNGHFIMLTGITGHLGTPGLSIYCAAQWAIEGYCDSLAYEMAPFNIRMSIVQSNLEVSVLSNKLTAVPPMTSYMPPENTAPLCRGLLAGILDKLWLSTTAERKDTRIDESFEIDIEDQESRIKESLDTPIPQQYQSFYEHQNSSAHQRTNAVTPGMLLLSPAQTTSLYPPLSPSFRSNLTAETVYAILAIGGHINPPARHIVGFDGVAAVKEKLKTVTEELEDFVDASAGVDF